MFETLNHIDQDFFLAINSGLQNAFFDWLCPIFRNQKTWYALYAVLLYFFYRKHGRQTIWIVLGVAVLILASDQLSATVIKQAFQRLRPCNDPSFLGKVHLLVPCGSGFSFVSTHATNHFALAVFTIGFFRKDWSWFAPVALLWASFIGFSQVYVGLHYPFDVICGGLLGSLLGYLAARLMQEKIMKRA